MTLQRLGASERLAETLGSTNPIESMIEVVRRFESCPRYRKRPPEWGLFCA